MNYLVKWKVRLAAFIPWLTDEEWVRRNFEKLPVGMRRTSRKLVESQQLDGDLLGRIYFATFRDGSVGYIVDIFTHVRPMAADGLIGHAYISQTVYESVEKARQALPMESRRAREKWELYGPKL